MKLELLRELNDFDEMSEYNVSTNGYGDYVLRDEHGVRAIGGENEIEEWLTKRIECMKRRKANE